jgi:hypothetical protein
MKKLLLISLVCFSSVALAEDKFAGTPADLQKALSKEFPNYKPVGIKTVGQLDKAGTKKVELKRGFCYVMVVRLTDGATWSEHTKKEGISSISMLSRATTASAADPA